ncbi:hypothetical protein ScalyP_jg11240, partial [Parmales sp. scaly parma]
MQKFSSLPPPPAGSCRVHLRISNCAKTLYEKNPALFPFKDPTTFDNTVGLIWKDYVELCNHSDDGDVLKDNEHYVEDLCNHPIDGDYNPDDLEKDILAERVSENFVFVVEGDRNGTYQLDRTVQVQVASSGPTFVESEVHEQVQCYQDLLRLWGSHADRPGPLHAGTVENCFQAIKNETTGIDKVLDKIKRSVFQLHTFKPEETKRIRKPNSLLLHGPPGTGKTTTIRHLLEKVGVFIIYIGSAAELKRPYIGETEKIIKFLFDQCKAHPECVCAIFLDEIDNITESRSGEKSGGGHKQDWISLLLRIIGSEDYPNLLLIGSTNRKSAMDEAILRPGRMDEQFFFPALGASARWEMFSEDFGGLNFEQQFKLMTTNLSSAGVKKILDSLNTAMKIGGLTDVWETRAQKAAEEGQKNLKKTKALEGALEDGVISKKEFEEKRQKLKAEVWAACASSAGAAEAAVLPVLQEAIEDCVDRDERALFTSADFAAVAGEHGTLKNEDLVMPKNGCLAIWGGRDGEWTIEGGGGKRKVKLGTFGRVQTQVKAWCAGVALANNAIYVHVLDSKALKDGKFDEEVAKMIFDEAKEMSSLDGSIIFVDLDELVGVQETVDRTFYEWQDNGGKVNSEDEIGTKFERVAVQRVQTVHVGQHLTENSETPYRHEEELDDSDDEDEIKELAPKVGKHETTFDISMSFKRPEIIQVILAKLQDFAGWGEKRKCGFVLKCENEINDLKNDIKAVKRLAKCFGKNDAWLFDDPNSDGQDPSKWVGEVKVKGGRIVEICWPGLKLSGNLNGKKLVKLDKLEVLDLHNNGIGGTIPKALEDMKNLQVLRLYQNNMEGPITLSKLGEMRECELFGGDCNVAEGNTFSTRGCPERFILQNGRNLLRICASKLGKDGLWLEDGKGPKGAWKGVEFGGGGR